MSIVENVAWKIMDIHRNLPKENIHNDIFLSLVFLKRMSDTFEDNTETTLNQSENNGIILPESARWDNLLKTKVDLLHHLMDVFDELEEKNNCLKGVFPSIPVNINDFENAMFVAMENLSLIDMSDSATENKFPEIFDLIISKMLDSKSRGEYTTNQNLSKLLVSLLEPEDGMAILDPFCGTGGLLNECAEYMSTKGGKVSLYGQEINDTVWRYCTLSLIVHNNATSVVKKGDSIRRPAFLDNGRLMQFDRVVSVPPFGKTDWGHEIAKMDEHNRFRYGIPPKSTGDMAHLQHMIASLKDDGKCVSIDPQGILFRGGPEGKIRTHLIENDFIDTIILLPPKSFPHTAIQTVVIVLDMNKPKERQNSILFISAENLGEDKKRQIILNDTDISKITDAYRNFSDVEKFCRVIDHNEIRNNEHSLNFSLYVDTYPEIETVDLKGTLQKIQDLQSKKKQLLDSIVKVMN